MEINDLHQALAELETNLRNLDSARKQVELISTESQNVNISTKELIEKLEHFIKLTSENTIDFTEDFSQTLSEFQKELKDFINDSRKITDKENQQIRKLTSAFIDAINGHFDNFEEKSKKSFDNLENELKNISKTFDETTKKQVSNVNEIINSANNLIEKQEKEFETLRKDFINECKKQNKNNLYLLVGIVILIILSLIIQLIR